MILYFRNNLNCKHRPEFELSKLETIWPEITLSNSKPFLICMAYRPPNATSSWIDLLEEELSSAQTTGLEIILMGDINIDLIFVQIISGFTSSSFSTLLSWLLTLQE